MTDSVANNAISLRWYLIQRLLWFVKFNANQQSNSQRKQMNSLDRSTALASCFNTLLLKNV